MNLQPWLPAQDSPEVPVNENFDALSHMAVYAKDATTTVGLTWGYLGGRWAGFEVVAGTLALTASATNYVVVARATGVVSVATATASWDNTTAYARVYKLTTGPAAVTAVEDWRAGTGGVHGVGSPTGGGGGGASDAEDVAYTPAVSGAPATTVDMALDERLSLKGAGGVGDGVASDQTAVAAAIASGFSELLVNDGHKFLVTSLTNMRGVDLRGAGDIVKAITGGLQKLNSYGDRGQWSFGQEYMAAWHKLLIAQTSTPTRKPIIVFSGDSTTLGTGVGAGYTLDALLQRAATLTGMQTPYGISCVNRGQSGKNTAQWVRDYVAGDLSANPDLLVLRWGLNDPGFYSANPDSGPAADAGQSAAGRRTVNDYLTSLRAGLAAIRASRSVSSLSILLMAPNAVGDTPNARDELWLEQIIPGIKQAARDYGCAFFDTYAYLRDARQAAGVWMDNPYSDGRAIHPADVMNLWIADAIQRMVFPGGLRGKLAGNGLRNVAGVEDAGSVTRLPSAYDYGITIGRAQKSVSAWPLDGSVITVRSKDETVLQILYPYKDAERTGFQFRLGRAAVLASEAATWGSWISVGAAGSTSQANVTPSSGYTIPSTGQARAVKEGNQVICEGYITKTTPAVLAAGSVVGTLPAGFRPISEAAYWNAVVWDGASGFAYVVARVSPSGTVDVATATSISVARIWLNVHFSTLS